ncbi:MAG TPA: response regulator transcription factor [Vicinamibacterales bacterium]|nr:response regulator transcription factor [Vicinamibacterales bacterium]
MPIPGAQSSGALERIRVFLADDHETVRQGLRLLLETQSDMEVVGEAAEGSTVLERIAELKPDVVVLDISMPGLNGLATARLLRTTAPDLGIVALTRYRDDAYVSEMVSAGALGYVLKQSPSSELLRAVRAAASGESYLDPRLKSSEPGGWIPPPAGRAPRITKRETQVLRLMSLGHSNKEIAAQLGLSVKTVEVHKTNATRKLGLRGRIDIVRYAVLQGWLTEP